MGLSEPLLMLPTYGYGELMDTSVPSIQREGNNMEAISALGARLNLNKVYTLLPHFLRAAATACNDSVAVTSALECTRTFEWSERRMVPLAAAAAHFESCGNAVVACT